MHALISSELLRWFEGEDRRGQLKEEENVMHCGERAREYLLVFLVVHFHRTLRGHNIGLVIALDASGTVTANPSERYVLCVLLFATVDSSSLVVLPTEISVATD